MIAQPLWAVSVISKRAQEVAALIPEEVAIQVESVRLMPL
jgi:hypothetical protein